MKKLVWPGSDSPPLPAPVSMKGAAAQVLAARHGVHHERERRAMGLSPTRPPARFLRGLADDPLERAEARLTEMEILLWCHRLAARHLPGRLVVQVGQSRSGLRAFRLVLLGMSELGYFHPAWEGVVYLENQWKLGAWGEVLELVGHIPAAPMGVTYDQLTANPLLAGLEALLGEGESGLVGEGVLSACGLKDFATWEVRNRLWAVLDEAQAAGRPLGRFPYLPEAAKYATRGTANMLLDLPADIVAEWDWGRALSSFPVWQELAWLRDTYHEALWIEERARLLYDRVSTPWAARPVLVALLQAGGYDV